MSNIAVTITEGTTVDTFPTAVAEGRVRFYSVRGNGTTRHMQYLTGKDREIAEWVVQQREEGVTMKAIAAEALMSVPTLRRLINALALTEEVDEYDAEDIAALLAEAFDGTEAPAPAVSLVHPNR